MPEPNLNAALLLIAIAFACLVLLAIFSRLSTGLVVRAREFWVGTALCLVVSLMLVGSVRNDWLHGEWCRYRSAGYRALNACKLADDCELTQAQVDEFKRMKRNRGIVQCLYRVESIDAAQARQDQD